MAKPGPAAGSEGARKIAEAHRGSHDPRQRGRLRRQSRVGP